MSTRPTRHRRTFRLESLEIRNAPSHFGVVAHVAAASHHAHAPAVVRHFNDTQAADKSHAPDKRAGVELSRDSGVETTGNDPTGKDSNSLDLKSNP